MKLTLVIKIILFFCFISYSSFNIAQNPIVVKGIVTDSTNLTIPGVRVMIKGTLIDINTDIDGNYSIEIPDTLNNFSLIYSFVGCKPKVYSFTRDSIDKSVFILNLVEDVKN